MKNGGGFREYIRSGTPVPLPPLAGRHGGQPGGGDHGEQPSQTGTRAPAGMRFRVENGGFGCGPPAPLALSGAEPAPEAAAFAKSFFCGPRMSSPDPWPSPSL